MEETFYWYVLYVKHCMERKVAQRLEAKGIESYIPIRKEWRQYSDRRKLVDRILLPDVVFVHVQPERRVEALQTPGSSRYLVLRGEHEPAIVPDAQMQQFQFMLNHSPEAQLIGTVPPQPGDAVEIIKGPLQGLRGELLTLDGKYQVAVRIASLCCATVDTTLGFIRKIQQP